jgi:predicted NBD/HSP70 family sugar kinase
VVTTASAIGVDIGGTKMLLLAHGPQGEPQRERRLDTGPTTNPQQLEHHIRDFARSLPTPPRALGIAVPGLVNHDAGRVEVSDVLPHLGGWQPANILGPDIPQILVNDIRAALTHTSRSLPCDATAAVLVAGTAIGMAWMADGRIINGVSGWAGEIGSMPLPTPEGFCRLDELAGGAAILANTGLSPAEVHAALATADPRIEAIVQAAGETFGLAIATVVNLINPQVITLAGGTLSYRGYLQAALHAAEHAALPPLWQACTVQRADNEPRVVALGALHLANQAGAAH